MDSNLFVSKRGAITQSLIGAALKEINIKLGDSIMIHSGLSVFGKLATLDINRVGNSIIQAFINTIGNGTLIFPTFSYSFCNGVDFDPHITISTVGSLTNIFWQRPDTIRSHHPIFSVAALGMNKHVFTNTPNNICFGLGSFFDLLVKKRVKVVGFGAELVKSMTLLHHLEEIAQVPYRFYKTFKGNITFRSKQSCECSYYVRRLNIHTQINYPKLTKYLVDHSLLKKIDLGSGWVEVVEADEVFIHLITELSSDPYFLVSQ